MTCDMSTLHLMTDTERSRAYPAAGLAPSIESAQKVQVALGKNWHDRESVAKGMGYAKLHGGAARRVASLVHYGLLERKGDQYRVSELMQRILHPKDASEKAAAIRDAFLRPTIFAEITTRFSAEGRLPTQFSNILVRDFGITAKASADVAQTYRESGEFAGVLDATGAYAGTASETGPSVSDADLPIDNPREADTEPSGNAGDGRTQTFDFSLTGGRRARLSVPSKLTARDVLIIRKQIELLDLQIGTEAEEPK